MSLPVESMLKDAGIVERHLREVGSPCTSPVFDVCTHVRALAAEVERLTRELDEWRTLTTEEAQAAYDAAEAVPMSEEEINRIVERCVDPAERLKNSEEAQLAVRVKRLTKERDDALARLSRLASDALAALAGAKMCTPAEGYIKAPHCLPHNIEDLARERDKARDECERLRECISQIAQIRHISGGPHAWNNHNRRTLRMVDAVLEGADLRDLEVVEAVAAGTWRKP